MSEIRTHEQVVGIIGILAQEANDDGVNEREQLGPQTRQAIEWLSATDAALRAENERLRALARFGALLLPKWWDDGCPYDIDGGDAQAAAEKAGLWRQVEKHADGVECEWCGGEGPCGELTEAGLAALAATEPAAALPDEVREAADNLRKTLDEWHRYDIVTVRARQLLAALASRGGSE